MAQEPKKRFIESSSFFTNKTSKDPFHNKKIEDSSYLNDLPSRSFCPVCNRSRKYFCYTCYVAVPELSSRLPCVKLPVQIDIIKHPKEVDGKSTSAHAAVLAPADVKVYIYPDFPSYDAEKVLLIFPGKNAVSFQDWWFAKTSPLQNQGNSKKFPDSQNIINEDVCEKSLPFSKVVFIDSTWRQAKSIYSDEKLKNLPCVFLSSYQSLFWRYYRGKKESHLSTVEAIYYFVVELRCLMSPGEPYDGRFDNLLFFFKFMYYKIRELYDPETLKAYQDHES